MNNSNFDVWANECIDNLSSTMANCMHDGCPFYTTVKDCAEFMRYMSLEPAPSVDMRVGDGECGPEIHINPGYSTTIATNQRFSGRYCVPESLSLLACNTKTKVAEVLGKTIMVNRNELKKQKELIVAGFFNNAFATNVYYDLDTNLGDLPIAPPAAISGLPFNMVYTAPDGQPVIGTHFWASTGNSFTNQAPSNAPLSSAALQAAFQHGMHNIKDAQGMKMCVKYDRLWVVRCSPNEHLANMLLERYQKITPNSIDQQNVFSGKDKGCYGFEICYLPDNYVANKDMWFLEDSTFWKRNGGTHDSSFVYHERSPLKVEKFDVECNGYCVRYSFVAGAGLWNLPIEWYGSNGSGMA